MAENMAESEAVEKLKAYHKCQRLQVKGIYEDCNEKLCGDCDLCYMQGTAGEHIKSIEIAIQALEKQIAKKVKIEQWIYTKCDCGYEFSKNHGDGYYSIPLENKTKYCPNCGQKLDWSDEE